MRTILLTLACCLVAHAVEMTPKEAAIDKYLALTHAAEAFRKGAEAGFEIGFDPKNNPAFAMVDPAKLEIMTQELKALFAKEFTFALVKDDMKSIIDTSFTLDELNELNVVLEQPIMQKFFQQQIKNLAANMALGQEAVKPLQPKIMAIVQKHLQP